MSNKPLSWSEPGFTGLIGVARRDITPPAGVYARNWGAAAHDIAEGVHRPLLCTVLTVRSDGNQNPLVLAAIDATWFRGPEGALLIRDHVCRELGVPSSALMISLSHTHSGPSLSPAELNKPGGSLIKPYVEGVASAIVEAARAALESECRAELRFATGRCGLAADRDLQDPAAPRLVCGFNPRARSDDTCLVGRVSRSSDGVTLATIVNYACHPTTLGAGNRLLSPDFIGAMRETVEAHAGGAPCLYLQGASGELAPRLQYTADTAIADAHGRELGHAAVAALEGMLAPGTALNMEGVVESGAPLAIWGVHNIEKGSILQSIELPVDLPLKPSLRSEPQILDEMARCEDRAAKERLHRELLVARTVGAGSETSRRPVWIWRIGEILLVGHSDEAYSQLQQQLRSAFPDFGVVVMNVVNGWGGYICPAARYEQRVYQAQQSPYASGCLELFIDRVGWTITELLAVQAVPESARALQGSVDR